MVERSEYRLARPPQIRLTKNDRAEYAKLAKNSKAKIRRTLKNYGVDLSQDIDIPNIEQFQTRKEFNEWKEKQSSFLNKNNLRFQFVKNIYGVVATKSEINKIARDTKRAQRLADEERKAIANKPLIVGGKVQVATVGQQMLQMGGRNTFGISRPPDFNFNSVRSKYDLEKKKINMSERSDPAFFDKRKDQMRKNYIKMLEDMFNSDANEIIEKIKQIHPEDFYELYIMANNEFDFNEFYLNKELDEGGEWSDAGYMDDLKRLNNYLDQYFLGNVNFDLKGF